MGRVGKGQSAQQPDIEEDAKPPPRSRPSSTNNGSMGSNTSAGLIGSSAMVPPIPRVITVESTVTRMTAI